MLIYDDDDDVDVMVTILFDGDSSRVHYDMRSG